MARVSLPLLSLLLCTAVAAALVRQKREWIPPRKALDENRDYGDDVVGKIFSDSDDRTGKIVYSLEGPGASQYPFNVFVVDSKTGNIRVTRPLDREEFSEYNLTGVAKKLDGTLVEQKILLRFQVVDVNDNPPVFEVMKPGAVNEHSPAGTPVMKISATDADEGLNSQIAYSIVSQDPDDDMFYITPDGELRVASDKLDREKSDKYVVVVKGQDMNGDPKGHVGSGTVTININDINDNPPTLEKDSYEGSIMENTDGVEVMRLKAQDLDLVNTPNWEADFEIEGGNEAGYFTIKTDPITNEGVLMLVKPVDFEDVQELDLSLAVKNKAVLVPGGGGGGGGGAGAGAGAGAGGGGGAGLPGFGTGNVPGAGTPGASGASGGAGGGSKRYPVKIKVQNEPEGARFDPSVKAIPISEAGHTFNPKDVIGQYQAIDQDTGKPAENVK